MIEKIQQKGNEVRLFSKNKYYFVNKKFTFPLRLIYFFFTLFLFCANIICVESAKKQNIIDMTLTTLFTFIFLKIYLYIIKLKNLAILIKYTNTRYKMTNSN